MTPQEVPRRSKTFPRRLQDVSKTTPRRLPDGPRYSQDAPLTALNSPRHPNMLPRRPKTPMDASKTPPDLDVGASGPQFLYVFTCEIVSVWIVWGSCFKCEFLPDYMPFHTRICKMIIRLLSYYVAGAVAGTQLCCAVDPPRQALCLRMACRIPHPNKILILMSLYISL